MMLLSELLRAAAARAPTATAIVRGERALTYAELHRDAFRLARGLQELGLRTGDRIGVFGEPTIELVIALHAAVAVGAVPIGFHPTYSRAETQAMVDNADVAAIVFDGTQAAMARGLAYPRPPIAIDETVLRDQIRNSEPLSDEARPAPDDVAVVVYTGATTGRPKGVVHTHRTIATWFGMTGAPVPTARTLLSSLAYASGLNTVWASAFNGSCMILFDRYPPNAQSIVDTIERERVTGLAVNATTLREIFRLPDIEARDFSSIKSVVIGGMPISTPLLQRTAKIFSAQRVFHNYGLTESGNDVSLLPYALAQHRPERLRSVGHPGLAKLLGLEPCEVRIIDPERRDVTRGDVGEIIVRSRSMMTGYWNDPAATAAALRDGWLYTGDLGRFDEHGYLYIVDRLHNAMVAINGAIVYSSEVERVLEQHPAIAEAAVVGTPRDDHAWMTAFAVLQPHAALSLAELKSFCADYLAGWKTPNELVIVDELPRTGIGKTNKSELRRIAASRT